MSNLQVSTTGITMYYKPVPHGPTKNYGKTPMPFRLPWSANRDNVFHVAQEPQSVRLRLNWRKFCSYKTFTSFYIDIILLITVVVVHVGSILECWRSGNGADVAIDSTGLLLDVIFINFQYLHMSCILSHCFHLCALCLCVRVHAYWRDSQEPRLTNVDQTSLNFSIVTSASISWHFSVKLSWDSYFPIERIWA